MYLRELATICLRPLRIAFDHLGAEGTIRRGPCGRRTARDSGNSRTTCCTCFLDDLADLFEKNRSERDADRNELGFRVWSFPMRYQPIDRQDRIARGSKVRADTQQRSMQVKLQATHGLVTSDPGFFRWAFEATTVGDFECILAMKHDMIFNSAWVRTARRRRKSSVAYRDASYDAWTPANERKSLPCYPPGTRPGFDMTSAATGLFAARSERRAPVPPTAETKMAEAEMWPHRCETASRLDGLKGRTPGRREGRGRRIARHGRNGRQSNGTDRNNGA